MRVRSKPIFFTNQTDRPHEKDVGPVSSKKWAGGVRVYMRVASVCKTLNLLIPSKKAPQNKRSLNE